MGKEDMNCIPRHLVSLVEDFDCWNMYPWGEYMWVKFYQRTVNVAAKHREFHLVKKKQNPNYYPTYNLYGFPLSFKIWILETYPNSKKWWSKKDNVLPRALAWSNVAKFGKNDYNGLLGPSTCSRHVVDNPIVACAGTGIHNPATNNDSRDSNHNDVNTGLSCSANDHMSNSSGPDIHLAKVVVACIEHDKGDGDGHIDIPTAIDNDVNLAKSISVNDLMPNDVYEGNVVSAKEGRLDVLIQVVCDGKGIDKADGIDFLQRDCSVAKPNDHPTADIGVKPLLVESNKSEYVNVVTDDYKPCLARIVFAGGQKKRRRSLYQTNNVLRSVTEDKKSLAMALESPFGQQPPTTLVPPKIYNKECKL
ncbi:hypothetical protein Tco_0855681 [Tanacetum coccineum]